MTRFVKIGIGAGKKSDTSELSPEVIERQRRPEKETKMETKMLLSWGLVGACLAACGCGPEKPKPVGFLSDYSHLRPETTLRSRYCPLDNRLARYSQFIVDPVPVYLDDKTLTKLGRDTNLAELAQYMHDMMVKTLESRYPVAGVTPGPGTGRIRMALTHLKKGGPFGVGDAAIEAELLDSQTGEQVVALREIQKGKSGSLSEWDDAKRIMDGWARRFYAVLEEHHARGPRPPVFSPQLQGLGG
jgi:hypothetical protein